MSGSGRMSITALGSLMEQRAAGSSSKGFDERRNAGAYQDPRSEPVRAADEVNDWLLRSLRVVNGGSAD